MNKFGVLAFSLLLFFSTMLWYLANGSLNEYLKSQIELQGQYYSGQETTLSLADFSTNTNIATLHQLTLTNVQNFQDKNALSIDTAYAELSAKQSSEVTEISKVTINKLTINIEQKNGTTNIEQLIGAVSLILANDYPESYPAISAKIYAQQHPDLDAEQYAKKNPQAGPIIEHTKQKKSRGKPQNKIIIASIHIKHLEVNTIVSGSIQSTQKYNINIDTIGGSQGLVTNQIGGEVLLHLLQLARPKLN